MTVTKATEFLTLTNSKDPKGFYQSMRTVWALRVNHPEQLQALNNKTIITEKHDFARWKDHFATMLNEFLI